MSQITKSTKEAFYLMEPGGDQMICELRTYLGKTRLEINQVSVTAAQCRSLITWLGRANRVLTGLGL